MIGKVLKVTDRQLISYFKNCRNTLHIPWGNTDRSVQRDTQEGDTVVGITLLDKLPEKEGDVTLEER